ncbi:MAG: hypothetical protein ACD_68C00073G0003, partial [uncultured bacterium]
MEEQEIVQPVRKLLEAYRRDLEKTAVKPEGPTIGVSNTVSTLAFLYEKVRNAVDIKEEHLLRKNAIHRFLSRRLVSGVTGSQIAKPLIQEMIRARYLKNNAVLEKDALDLAEIIDKYIYLMNVVAENNNGSGLREELFDLVVDLASCEVEEKLCGEEKQEILAQVMYEVIHDDITFRGEEISDEERDVQVF